MHIEYRWAEGRYDRLPAMAADLVNRRVAVIAAIGGSVPATAAKTATPTIPIVFQGGGDPVRLGLVGSLNHPGGNITGAMNLTGGTTDTKAVQFLREVVPAAASLGVLVNRSSFQRPAEAEAAARALQWEARVFEASTDDDLKTAFEVMAKRNVGAVSVVPDPFFTNRRAQIVALAAGLMSYGYDVTEQFRQAASYVDRILRGEKPADLPAQTPTRYEMVINLKTAWAIGLDVPPNVLGIADEVIE